MTHRLLARADGHVAALVATRGRNDLLRLRALPSILAQTRLPDRLFVVIDQSKEELSDASLADFKSLLRAQCGDRVRLTILRNRRTPQRASDAWNTGIDQLQRDLGFSPALERWYVAILDDDDAWEPDHLQVCLDEAVPKDLHMVAAGLVRHETADGPGHPHAVPEVLDAREQFIRGQHIQGSNLFVRLDALLLAGMFDPHLTSCTDRDICIRLSRLPAFRFGSVQRHTVHHFSDPRPDRLSAPRSAAKLTGLSRFLQKHADRFDAPARAEAEARARELFGWKPEEPTLSVVEVPDRQTPGERVSLVVGFVTDAEPPGHVRGLLEDLQGLRSDPGIGALRVVVVENGPLSDSGSRKLHVLADEFRAGGLDLDVVTLERQREDWERGQLVDTPDPFHQRLKIAVSRSVLNTYVGRSARELPGAWAWILDDDKRLHILIDDGSGRTVKRPSPDLAALQALRQRGVDVVIGPDTDSAPLPFVATLRMQLLDLEHLLGVMQQLSPEQALPDNSAQDRQVRRSLKDAYYDLCRTTEHLETPFSLPSTSTRRTAKDALEFLSERIDRLLAGESLFRPLLVEAETLPAESMVESVQRGGSAIFFEPRVLLEYPQQLARIGDTSLRRSDMVSALLMRDQRGLKIVRHPSAGVRHDRSFTKPLPFDDATLREDVLGYGFYRALEDLLAGRGGANPLEPLLAWTGAELTEAEDKFRKYVDERLSAFTLSGWRVFGLADLAMHACDDLARHPGWSDPTFQRQLATIQRAMHQLREQFEPKKISDYVERVRKLAAKGPVRDAFASMDGMIGEYRATTLTGVAGHQEVIGIREKRARALLAKAWGLEALRLLGAGGEGMVFTDERLVYKVLDLLKRRTNHDTLATLQALRARPDRPIHLYPIERLELCDETMMLAYPYEPSNPYEGGLGAELIALLRECKALGIVCRNVHPKNLRVAAGRLKLIDYGADIRPWSEPGYRSMAERAWLSWRWPHRPDLDELMRRALHEKALPEMDGFERFWWGLNEELPSATGIVAALVEPLVLDAGAKRVLDYGCGKQARSVRNLAEAGLQVVGFDPGSRMGERWARSFDLPVNATLHTDREAALADAPFDAVLCSLVLCELPDSPEYEQVLADIGRAVTGNGEVFVTICNPLATFGGPTPLHRHRVLPPDVSYADTFTYTERAETGVDRDECHRPLQRIERDLLRHGLRVECRLESRSVDLERFEPATDFVTLVCRPVASRSPEPRVSLVIKSCAMEALTIERQVAHLVRQLEGPRAFHERVLAVDSLRDGFVRQHSAADFEAMRSAATRLVAQGLIDRVVQGPGPGAESRRLNRSWFDIESDATHSIAGAPLATPLSAFEACAGDYILQVDSDLLVGRADPLQDCVGEMIEALRLHEDAVCAALNIPGEKAEPFTSGHGGIPWRVEVRGCLLDRNRLLAARPLPNRARDGRPERSWHRALDEAVKTGRASSLRGGSRATYFVHPQNNLKRNTDDWMLILDAVEKGRLPAMQSGKVDLVGGPLDWAPRERAEPVVFVITGWDVSPGRAARCLESLSAQSDRRWGAVVIDDGSSDWSREHLRLTLAPWAGRVTLLQPRERRGQLANMVMAVRQVCTDPETIVVTLDLDDALVGAHVVERIVDEYRRGADVTVGSMLRTDKHADYPVQFDGARRARGGNVWQHLRSFKKHLFDAIPDHELRIDGQYVDIAVDWAFMLPIVELAERPAWIRDPLYLYEPSGLGKGIDRERREEQIATIVARPAQTRQISATGELE